MMTLAERVAEPDLAGLSEPEVVARLNAPDPALPSVWQDVSREDAADVLRRNMAPDGERTCMVALMDLATDMQNPARNVARAADELFSRGSSTIYASRAQTGTLLLGMLTTLMNAGVMTQETRAELLAMMKREQSWAEANGYPAGVTTRDVGIARGSAP